MKWSERKYIPALGGLSALIVAMGAGRFAYTPLLPFMQEGARFDDSIAGLIASSNYAGYLVGALVFGYLPRCWRVVGFRLSLVLMIFVTAAMGIMDTLAVWYLLRFLAGILSAAIFVLGSLLVMEALAQRSAIHLSGLMYSGVGIGIALSAVGVAPLCEYWSWQGAWIGLGLLSIPPVALAWLWVKPPSTEPTASPSHTRAAPNGLATQSLRGVFLRLGSAYFLEGMGYVVSATFLVLIIRTLLDSPLAGTISWLLVGISAAISTSIWPLIAAKIGEARALMMAHGIQAVGVICPVLWPTLPGAYIGSILFGGTIMGIVTLTMMYGRNLAPEKAGAAVGLLTALFGAGQIIAPALAGYVAKVEGSFTLPLVAAAIAVAVGGLILLPDGRKGQ